MKALYAQLLKAQGKSIEEIAKSLRVDVSEANSLLATDDESASLARDDQTFDDGEVRRAA